MKSTDAEMQGWHEKMKHKYIKAQTSTVITKTIKVLQTPIRLFGVDFVDEDGQLYALFDRLNRDSDYQAIVLDPFSDELAQKLLDSGLATQSNSGSWHGTARLERYLPAIEKALSEANRHIHEKNKKKWLDGERKVTMDMLLLVGRVVTKSEAASWDYSKIKAIQEWVGATHLSASDNNVKIPKEPKFNYRDYRSTFGKKKPTLGDIF